MAAATPQATPSTLDRLLLVMALLYSIILTTPIWVVIAAHQPIWPFPGLYFIEVMFLPGLALLSTLRAWPHRVRVISGCAGAVTSFSVLGAGSIGLFYLPLALLLFFGALSARARTRDPIAMLLVFFFVCAAAQAWAMLAFASRT